MSIFSRPFWGASIAVLTIASANFAQAAPSRETVIVTGEREAAVPNQTESISATEAEEQVNVVNTEDVLKYLPSILVRKRHIGDTQDPVTTRTSGVGASARSLIYADGILLSALIGNNNTSASPKWGMVAPEEIARIDVIYGPFSAQYPGNSMGETIEIVTRMPQAFEINAQVDGALQSFSQYATKDTYSTYQMSAGIGDRVDNFAFRLSANHLNTYGQPLSYITLARPSSQSAAGLPVSGAFSGVNRTGTPIAIVGAGGLEHQIQDNVTLKLAYELSGHISAKYTLGFFNQTDNATVESYLRDAGGAAVYAGNVNIGGYNYAIGPGSFSNAVSRYGQAQLAQGLTFKFFDDAWDGRLTLSRYDFLRDVQRVPAAALPAAFDGGAGSITQMDGTGWYTVDVKLARRITEDNSLSFGAHYDRYKLSLRKFGTSDWLTGTRDALVNASRGKTATAALWTQDAWHFAPGWNATVGGRFENWQAFDGENYSQSPALDVSQPKLSGSYFSPKASLAWQPGRQWTFTASYGRAYRMPTVMELYQAVTTGTVLSVPNPNLNPERADSYELSAEYAMTGGRVRLSLFEEDVADALISQSTPLPPGSTSTAPISGTLFNFVQNVDRVRSRGIEAVVDRNDVLFEGLQLSGSLTFVDSRIVADAAFPKATGKRTPQVPKWRASMVATYRPDESWAITLAARYADRSFGTIDNSDIVSHTYQGFEGYFVLDARAHYEFDTHWSAAFGIDNLNNRKYFIFHPFPQRTFLLELKYAQ
ncbi:MAG TPA: TonB-dependent receptor [Rhizomicrobium sp.]|nr:TonB-dependent receptor [Rhizomicrobium sp.]